MMVPIFIFHNYCYYLALEPTVGLLLGTGLFYWLDVNESVVWEYECRSSR